MVGDHCTSVSCDVGASVLGFFCTGSLFGAVGNHWGCVLQWWAITALQCPATLGPLSWVFFVQAPFLGQLATTGVVSCNGGRSLHFSVLRRWGLCLGFFLYRLPFWGSWQPLGLCPAMVGDHCTSVSCDVGASVLGFF